jgi:hypothetical protein
VNAGRLPADEQLGADFPLLRPATSRRSISSSRSVSPYGVPSLRGSGVDGVSSGMRGPSARARIAASESA